MLYCATSGCEVDETAVSGGVKFPEPQPTDARANRMQADKYIPVRESFKYAFPRFEKTEKAGRSSNVFCCLDQENSCRSDDIGGFRDSLPEP